MRKPERISVEEYHRLAQEATAQKGGKPRPKKIATGPALRIPKPKRDISPLAVLTRLMEAAKLSTRIRLQPEERLAVDFANALRAATLAGTLKAVWTHPANEIAGRRSGLSQIRYAIAKRMGLIDGAPDYIFLAANKSGVLEAKVGKNQLQDNQKDFRDWCLANGVEHAVFRSVDEGLGFLRQWGLLLDQNDQPKISP